MKKLLSFILIIMSILIYPQVVIKKFNGYQVTYSVDMKIPLIVEFKVLCGNRNEVSRNYRFYEDKVIKSASDKDYYKSGYDRGHMFPAEDGDCNQIFMKESFSYLNVVPQDRSLNRGPWKSIEQIESRLSRNSKIRVKILIIPGTKYIGRVNVPKGFYRYIWQNNILIRTYYFPNEKPKSKNLKYYEVK
jgi:endonuclease G